MSFYAYRQNNSGGFFNYSYDQGISVWVIVEADSTEDANSKAVSIGLYFDGEGDCDCCGDRWYPANSWTEGDSTPKVYGRDVAFWKGDYGYRDGIEWDGFIHYKNGTKLGFGHGNGTPGIEVLVPEEKPKATRKPRAKKEAA